MKADRNYDYQRAAGLLAYVYTRTGSKEQAAALFEQVTLTSTLSETQFNYACLLADQGKTDEARKWAQKIVAKKSRCRVTSSAVKGHGFAGLPAC